MFIGKENHTDCIKNLIVNNLKEEQMLGCLVNIDAVLVCLRQPGQRFKQGKREDKAATAIQSAVRMQQTICRYH
ncbi:uncharacterized protein MONOS_8826 [Monocercomonoides exilis]|uniref:uncharacterized protein n=1 Tax=Monocercomonoides exilis TaxID=2049356 RepID=UPI0035596C64|nr:hypothetical protein MONOS_8826 [Monocercomonoides exilis]|eukprot:MONOS_8826.1-p1 / transcript=MONOS_8826.1 / gene=MONOS_8826 / organism=Monocercomonoides_exilis_PA203 / gene_product=unspecified product / transcript_product=unspecified product / location=Mono_scaffold00344:14372-14744(+) / protein_length=74 / sequence_SO=supercontig / SO=protein_coding / is_pseudo=false